MDQRPYTSSRGTYSGTSFAGAYFAVQALAVAAWWWGLWRLPDLRPLFLPEGISESVLLAFWLPDLLLLAIGSALAAVLFFRRSPAVIPVAWLTAGAVTYATLYCIALALPGDEGGWWSVVFMLPATGLSLIAATEVSVEHVLVFRRARQASPAWNLTKTLVQISLFWSTFLGLFPAALSYVETQLALPRFTFPGQLAAGVTLFLLCSTLGLASGITMARRGAGTPLPLDASNSLVVAGPYRYLRNPMVVAGLGQGAAVALALGSWTVLVYVLSGGLVWQLLVRPAEEADLASKFGDAYEQYRWDVSCWWPRLRR